MPTRPYKTFECDLDESRIAIQFTDGEFSDVMFSYGKTEFEEKDDQCILHFEYDVISGNITEEAYPRFQRELGDFLVELLQESIEHNQFCYTGGTDENRENHTESTSDK